MSHLYPLYVGMAIDFGIGVLLMWVAVWWAER